jgi:hypothetical protein
MWRGALGQCWDLWPVSDINHITDRLLGDGVCSTQRTADVLLLQQLHVSSGLHDPPPHAFAERISTNLSRNARIAS